MSRKTMFMGRETLCTKAIVIYVISAETFSIMLVVGMKFCQVGWSGAEIIQRLKSCSEEGQSKIGN
jgi:hypothetical protein